MLDSRRRAYLAAMGIDQWQARVPVSSDMGKQAPVVDQAQHAPASIPKEAVSAAPPVDSAPPVEPVAASVDELNWSALAERVANCRDCSLCDSRTQTVFGVGSTQADLLVVGEAPGADEDRQGEPFVGRAGQLLTAMLGAIKLQRQQVYIANVLKCQPPGNRDPHVEEVAACQGYLNRQIELLQPRLIVAVGGVAAKHLLNTDESVGRLRGKLHAYPATGTRLLVTYHPAYLLREPQEKAKVWADLQKVEKLLAEAAE